MTGNGNWTLRPTHRISIRGLARAEELTGRVSLRDVADARNLPFDHFSVHELLTPQFTASVAEYETEWENWIRDYEGGTAKLSPSSKREFVGTVVRATRQGKRIRAVGAAHSHSRAAQPEELYLDLASHAPLFEMLSELEDVLSGADNFYELYDEAATLLAHLDSIRGYPLLGSALSTWEDLLDNLDRAGSTLRRLDRLVVSAIDDPAEIMALREDLLDDLANLPDPPYGHEGLLDHGAWLKADPPGVGPDQELVRAKSGTMLKRLMRIHLADADQGLSNMGSWDGQTLAGAINTGTHGTGLRLPALPDMVRSVELVTVTESHSGDPLVQLRRIEPDDGITHRGAFEAAQTDHHTVLHQDDDLFHAAVLGYGCLGIAYSYTLAVEDETYWIEEVEDVERYPDLLSNLRDHTGSVPEGQAPAIADDARHVNFLINVAKMQGEHATRQAGCLVRKRSPTTPVSEPDSHTYDWPPERRRTLVEDLLQDVSGGVDPRQDPNAKHHDVINLADQIEDSNFDKNRTPFMGGHHASAYYIALRRLRDASDPHRPPAPPTRAISADVAVPAREVADAIAAVVAEIQVLDVYVAVPLGVRFVAPSEHFLAPEYDRLTAMIEITFPVESANGLTTADIRDDYAKPALDAIVIRLINDHHGRPHLGKYNGLDRDGVEAMFPEFDAWHAVYRALNPFGTFDNGFTDQLGISTGSSP